MSRCGCGFLPQAGGAVPRGGGLDGLRTPAAAPGAAITFALHRGFWADSLSGPEHVFRHGFHPARHFFGSSSQFTTPASYAYGNSARSYTGLRSDRAGQLDFSLLKNTKIHERWNLQFRAEFFNLTNTPRFAPPNMTQGNNQFGNVSSMGNQPRVIQFALKLLY